MKTLIDYINEQLETSASNVYESAAYKWFRFNLEGVTGGYETLKAIADRNKLYNEPIDGGIKIEIKPNQEEKLANIIEFFIDFVNSNMDDDKCKPTCERIQGYIDEMEAFIEEKEEETEEKEEETKEEDESKEGE